MSTWSWGTTPSAHRCHRTGDLVKPLSLPPNVLGHFLLKLSFSLFLCPCPLCPEQCRENLWTHISSQWTWYQNMFLRLSLTDVLFHSLDAKPQIDILTPHLRWLHCLPVAAAANDLPTSSLEQDEGLKSSKGQRSQKDFMRPRLKYSKQNPFLSGLSFWKPQPPWLLTPSSTPKAKLVTLSCPPKTAPKK